MRINTFFSGSRTVLGRALVASALVGASAVVGLASTASAADTTATHLFIHTAPSSSVASGAALGTQPVIYVADGSDAPDTGSTDLITATVSSGGTIVGSGTATASSGVASFGGLGISALAGPYTLTFTDTSNGSITSVNSSTINVTAGAATHLAITTQPSTGAISGSALGSQPVIKAEDAAGNVDTSGSGTITATSTNAGSVPISAGSTATMTSGVATFSGLTLTGADGATTTLTFAGDSNTSSASNTITMSGAANKLAITTLPAVTDASGVALSPQPVITVEDSSSNRVYADSSTVTATVTGAGGTVTSGTAVASNGVATFSGLALNALAGSYTLTFTDSVGGVATVQSASITVSMGPAAKLAIVTEPSSSVQAGAVLSQQPVVKVEDTGGNLVTSNTSTVTATLTVGSGTITNASVAASGGIATFTALTINAAAGGYTLTFSDGGLTTAISTNITVGVGAASKIVVTVEPSATVASGVALAVQPVVKIEDSGGDVITGNTTTVTAVITSGSGTLTNATAVVSPSTGLATFSGLAINALAGTYSLTFSDGSLTTAVSTNITLTAGAAAKLVITTQPSTTDASGAALATQPVVKVEDAAGNVVATDTSTVTAKITTGGVSVTSPTAVAAAGVATFSGLALNALVGGYTLTFTDGTLTPAVSNSVTVSTGAANKLAVTTEPSSSAASGVALAVQPVVKVEDSGGNLVTSVNTGYVTASVYTGAAGAVSAGVTAAISAGVATFSGLTITGTQGNSYTLLFTGDSLGVNDSTAIKLSLSQAALTVTSVNAILGRSLTLASSGGSSTGAVTFALSGGTATGCTISGSTLTYSSTGTCIVTATKAGDSTYLAVSSAATTVTVAKLRIPGAVRVTFKANSSALSATGKAQLRSLATKLTVRSHVTFYGYALHNLALAKARARSVANYLHGRLGVHVTYRWVTTSPLQAVRAVTTAQ